METGAALKIRSNQLSRRFSLLGVVFSLLWLAGSFQPVRADDPATPIATDFPFTAEASAPVLSSTPETSTPVPSATPELPTLTPLPLETPTLAALTEAQPRVKILVGLSNPDLLLSRKNDLEQNLLDQELSKIGVVVLDVPLDEVDQRLADLENAPGLRYVELDQELRALETIPDDPGWPNQGSLLSIRAPQGWDLSTGSSAVTIAILDTGVDYSHLEFAGKLLQGYDFVNLDSNAQDDNGHGTHVAGIAAAVGNNGLGVAGVAWGARLLPVKVLNASGGGSYANAAAGIIWAVDQGAQVINLSLGGPNPSQVLEAAIQYAAARGVVLVAASGNAGAWGVLYPARYQPVIAVGAVDNAGNHASFSNFGPELDLVAPGVSIYSTLLGGYGYKSGTSMSTPLVSGLAAVLRGLPLGASPQMIAWQMESTALDLGPAGLDDYFGNGLIQMDRAIRLAFPPTATSTATSTVTTAPAGGPRRTATSSAVPGSIALPGRLPPPGSPVGAGTPSPTPPRQTTPGLTRPVEPSLPPPTKTPTPTATGSATADEPETRSADAVSYLLPCLGSAFILTGLLLAWVAARSGRLRF